MFAFLRRPVIRKEACSHFIPQRSLKVHFCSNQRGDADHKHAWPFMRSIKFRHGPASVFVCVLAPDESA